MNSPRIVPADIRIVIALYILLLALADFRWWRASCCATAAGVRGPESG